MILSTAVAALTAVGSSGVQLMGSGSDPLANIAITQDMLKPILDGIIANVGVILPIGLAIFAVVLGISFIPKIIGHFAKKG